MRRLAGIRSGPVRDGKHHDVHGGKAGDGEPAQEAASVVWRGLDGFGRELGRAESDCAQRIDGLCGAGILSFFEHDGGALRR